MKIERADLDMEGWLVPLADDGMGAAMRPAPTKTGKTRRRYEPAGSLAHGSFALAPEPQEHRILR
jgi:hypothetical protein